MSDKKQKSAVHKIIRIINSIVDNAMLLIFVFLLMVGCYSLWDTHTINQEATQEEYQVYKPELKDNRSFLDFQKVNPDVIGWVTIYGTKIDYPLLQAEDNDKYLNTAPDGSFALSGSIFLDYRNSPNFDDFNSIIYGHHMEARKMFGDIQKFKEREFFEKHRYGSLYFNGKIYGLEFGNFLEADAYDSFIFSPAVRDRLGYLNRIEILTTNRREIGLNETDQLVMLSTCASMDTNGRHILVARLMDEVPKDPFDKGIKKRAGQSALFGNDNLLRFLLLDAVLLIFVYLVYRKKKREDISE